MRKFVETVGLIKSVPFLLLFAKNMLSLKSCYAASRSSNLQVRKNKYRKSYSRWNSFGCNCQKVYKLHSLLWTPYLQITCSITYAGIHFFLFTYVLSNVLANLNEEREMQYECYNSHTKYKETKNSEITSSWDDQVVSVQTKGCWRVTFVSPDFFFTHDLKKRYWGKMPCLFENLLDVYRKSRFFGSLLYRLSLN